MTIKERLEALKNEIDQIIVEIEKKDLIDRVDAAQSSVPDTDIK